MQTMKFLIWAKKVKMKKAPNLICFLSRVSQPFWLQGILFKLNKTGMQPVLTPVEQPLSVFKTVIERVQKVRKKCLLKKVLKEVCKKGAKVYSKMQIIH